MRKIALAAVAALALPIAVPAMAQQNGAKQNPPAQAQQQPGQGQQQMQSNHQNPNSEQQLSRNEIEQPQQALDQKGFNAGRPDGKLGPKSKRALSKFQKSQGLQPTGEPDQQTLAALGANENNTTGQAPANEPMQGGQSQNQPSQQQPGQSGKNGK